MLAKPSFPVLERGHPLAQGLVLGLPFYEGSGLTANDLSGQGNTGTLTGGATWTGGQFGSCLSFDGTSGYVSLASSTGLGFTGNYTLAAWVYYNQLTDDGSDRLIFTRGTGAVDDIEVYQDSAVSGQGLTVAHNRGNGGTLAAATNNSNSNASNGGWGSVARGAWTHLVITYAVASTKWSVYMNGVLKGTATIQTGSLLNTSGGAWQIGNTTASATFGSTRFWKGQIDGPLIYNRALSGDEIAALYFDSFQQYRRPRTWFLAVTGGVQFDAASNSGYQSAASSLSWSHSWNGSNRLLLVSVEMLSANDTVTAMTYGGTACTLIGTQNVAGGTGRVEIWRIKQSDASAPGTGSNTISVTISGSLACVGTAVSYTGVDQIAPTEGFAGNSGIATGTLASVSVFASTGGTWVYAALATDTASGVAAHFTARNIVNGSLGTGADGDTPFLSIGTLSMVFDVGATSAWAMAGVAIRPVQFPPVARILQFNQSVSNAASF